MIPLFVWQRHDVQCSMLHMLESLPAVGRAHHAVVFLGSPLEQAGALGGLILKFAGLW